MRINFIQIQRTKLLHLRMNYKKRRNGIQTPFLLFHQKNFFLITFHYLNIHTKITLIHYTLILLLCQTCFEVRAESYGFWMEIAKLQIQKSQLLLFIQTYFTCAKYYQYSLIKWECDDVYKKNSLFSYSIK